MEQFEQNIERFKQPAMAIAGGIGAALVVATLPHVYLENIIGATGLSEIVPAAAPPLGNTARGLIAVMSGLVTASAIYFFINRTSNSSKEDSDMGLALPKFSVSDESVEDAGKAKFSMPKFSLKKLLQKPRSSKKDGKVTDLADLPKLREADSHPDAPARRPIFADADLGTPLVDQIKPFEKAEETPDAALQESPAEPKAASAPFTADKSLSVPSPTEQPLDLSGRVSVPESETAVSAPMSASICDAVSAPLSDPQEMPDETKEDMSSLSIAQLADRLETGLQRLKQLEIHSRAALDHPSPAVQQVAETAAVPGGINVTSAEEHVHTPPPLKSVQPSEEDVQAARQADMDAALKAALGTLEKMTAQR